MELTLEQQHAVELCTDMGEPIVSVTGGAGTGKTLVLGHAYKDARVPVLCAPTGRAAKRIQELTGIQAVTIHRLLRFPTPDDPVEVSTTDAEGRIVEVKNAPTDHEPRHNRYDPIPYRTVFVDEASMLGPTLFRQLMDAIPTGGVVRFFGDNNQLPPVEEGPPPFKEMLVKHPSVTLTFNFRNDDEIISNAQRILAGSIPLKNSRFDIVYDEDPCSILIARADPQFTDMNNQIIMPQRKGQWGTSRINVSLQLKYRPEGSFLRLNRFAEKEAPLLVRANDKFLWVKNDYNLNMFNGEIGNVGWVNSEDGALGLVIPDREVVVPPRIKTYSPYLGHYINYDPRKQIELGYAVTTHKAQGSEFDTVLYCMSSHASFMLNRQNFYTAVTRARKRVIVLTDRKAMSRAMRRV